MKNRITITCTVCALLALPAMAAEEITAKPDHIDFGKFEATGDGTFVEIKVNSSLITMAAQLTKESEPDIARILSGLRSIRINVMEFDDTDRKDVEARVKSIPSPDKAVDLFVMALDQRELVMVSATGYAEPLVKLASSTLNNLDLEALSY